MKSYAAPIEVKYFTSKFLPILLLQFNSPLINNKGEHNINKNDYKAALPILLMDVFVDVQRLYSPKIQNINVKQKNNIKETDGTMIL